VRQYPQAGRQFLSGPEGSTLLVTPSKEMQQAERVGGEGGAGKRKRGGASAGGGGYTALPMEEGGGGSTGGIGDVEGLRYRKRVGGGRGGGGVAEDEEVELEARLRQVRDKIAGEIGVPLARYAPPANPETGRRIACGIGASPSPSVISSPRQGSKISCKIGVLHVLVGRSTLSASRNVDKKQKTAEISLGKSSEDSQQVAAG
jgi:hypothetical protein